MAAGSDTPKPDHSGHLSQTSVAPPTTDDIRLLQRYVGSGNEGHPRCPGCGMDAGETVVVRSLSLVDPDSGEPISRLNPDPPPKPSIPFDVRVPAPDALSLTLFAAVSGAMGVVAYFLTAGSLIVVGPVVVAALALLYRSSYRSRQRLGRPSHQADVQRRERAYMAEVAEWEEKVRRVEESRDRAVGLWAFECGLGPHPYGRAHRWAWREGDQWPEVHDDPAAQDAGWRRRAEGIVREKVREAAEREQLQKTVVLEKSDLAATERRRAEERRRHENLYWMQAAGFMARQQQSRQ